MPDPTVAAQALAGAYLAGDWVPESMGRRGKRALADRRHWITDLARIARSAYPDRPADRPRELARFIAASDLFISASTDPARPLQVHTWMAAPTEMGPPPRYWWPEQQWHHRRRWPAIDSNRDLAGWLGVTTRHLEWFADARSFERTARDERLRHYRRRWIAKSDGTQRLIEAPKRELKDLQRQILREILDRAPRDPGPPMAWGQRGSPLPTLAAEHVGRQVVIRCDLESFFTSIPTGRVYGVFRWIGYPEPVAHTFAALCTTVTPPRWLRGAGDDRRRRMIAHLAHPHLPQGAPTSPALASLCSFRLDRRLARLASSFGGRYSRYVDDLIFSGDADLLRGSERFVRLVGAIVADEGYQLHTGKTRVRTASQRQTVTGLVVNAGVNVPRRDYDRLRALLHDAVHNGPEAANLAGHPDFRAHLLGRISWASTGNPTRAAKLRAAFDTIPWA